MNAQEKARELVDKFLSIQDTQSKDGCGLMLWDEAKQCAIIAVDEILNSVSNVNWIDEENINFSSFFIYWESVRQEIEKS